MWQDVAAKLEKLKESEIAYCDTVSLSPATSCQAATLETNVAGMWQAVERAVERGFYSLLPHCHFNYLFFR